MTYKMSELAMKAAEPSATARHAGERCDPRLLSASMEDRCISPVAGYYRKYTRDTARGCQTGWLWFIGIILQIAHLLEAVLEHCSYPEAAGRECLHRVESGS
jgi:hypothetical protein